MKQIDIAIVGSGIIGMAVARGLLELDSILKIAIFDKESEFGVHASARNSGVLHAGFYYSPDSMKARFCRDGRDELESLARRYSIPTRKVGKVVVAKNKSEENRLITILDHGITNGVQIEHMPSSDLTKIEPLAQTHGSFLWSPNTSIANPILINSALRSELISKGVTFIPGSEVKIQNKKWMNREEQINSRYFINAAGAWALDIAHEFNLGIPFRTMPFLGLYKKTNILNLPIATLIYPVPHPVNPFLGVHFTLTLDGFVKIGPSALPIIGKSQYTGKSHFSKSEFIDFGKNLISLGKSSKHDLFSMMRYEIPKLKTSNLVGAASQLVPNARKVRDWTSKSPGIRGQLINAENGELLQDFLVEHAGNSTHVLNAVSPGWTASIPFGRYIAQLVSERLESSL